MTRSLSRHIAPEMLGLLLVEAGLSVLLATLLLAPVAPGSAGQSMAIQQGLVVATALGFTSFLLGAYRPAPFARRRSLLLTTAVGGLLAFPAAWCAGVLLGLNPEGLPGGSPLWLTKTLATWIMALLAVRLTFQAVMRSRAFIRRVAVKGNLSAVAGTVAAIRTDRAASFEVVTASLSSSPDTLRAAGVRTLLIPAGSHALCQATVLGCAAAGIEVLGEAAFWEHHLRRVDIEHLTPAWFDALATRPRSPAAVAAYRAGDVLTSLALVLFTLPLMLLVAVVIRLDSPGPVLYRQERVGKDGRSFILLKFRSMNSNAEVSGPAWAQRRDPRVTRIGGLMRRTRIDELPQLLNVLRGEMSMIGPRPERPHFVEQLAGLIPFYRERARVKPGLTGWAQVNFPYGASVEDARAKLSYDLYYVKNQSPMLDLMILLATIRVILFQEGAR